MHYYCTYFNRHYLPRGLALYRSLTRHAGPFVLYVLCFDAPSYEALSKLNHPNLRPIALETFEQGDDALLEAKKTRSPVEYFFTCTPSLPLYILDHHPEVDLITYLDADLYFFANPAPIYRELGDQSILIVGHRFPEHQRHREDKGIYNVGWLSFRNDPYGRGCLNWWRARCLEWCYDRAEDGRYADQKYLDDWPTRFARVVVLQHKGANLAPWNVARYHVHESGDAVLVDSDPLIFYHFHNLSVISPFLFDPGLSKYKGEICASLKRRVYAPYLKELCALMWQTGAYAGMHLRKNRAFNRGEWM